MLVSRWCLLFIFSFVNFVQDVEQNGGEVEEGQHDEKAEEHDDGQEEAVVVDADSSDSAVLVNGNEAEEEWGTNTEGKPSA